MRLVFGHLEAFHEPNGQIGCDGLMLGELRVALQRTIDEIDELVESNPHSFLAKQVVGSLNEYRRDQELKA